MNKEVNDTRNTGQNGNKFLIPPSEEFFLEAVKLLKQLISTPSFSREEAGTANVLENFLKEKNVEVNRTLNNVWAVNKYFDPNKVTILLNSHHDTVKPNSGYTIDPFAPVEKLSLIHI